MNPPNEPAHPLSAYLDMNLQTLGERIEAVRRKLGEELLILGHHYQRDSIIEHTDLQGDSFQLSKTAAASDRCRTIVFCGVHFMAETADILANHPDKIAARAGRRTDVILPVLEAGCPMAEMASLGEVEMAWEELAATIDVGDLTPVTYVNSSAALKAFCGRHGGIVCTSSNAEAVLVWALQRTGRVLFFPDQHLGRNTGLKLRITEEQMPTWNPMRTLGGNSPETLQQSRVILWNGFCFVHQRFRAEQVEQLRRRDPNVKVIVHPECDRSVNDLADISGSTGRIIQSIERAPLDTHWAIGTERNLVERLARKHPRLKIESVSPMPSGCATMAMNDLPHLCWVLENLAEGVPVNVIRVDDSVARDAYIALERMLAVS